MYIIIYSLAYGIGDFSPIKVRYRKREQKNIVVVGGLGGTYNSREMLNLKTITNMNVVLFNAINFFIRAQHDIVSRHNSRW